MVKTQARWVFIEGTIQAGAAGTVAFVLPVEYRPVNRLEFACGGGAFNNVVIQSNGNVTVTAKGSGTVSLDTIQYYIGN
jgi:hypothetical protein